MSKKLTTDEFILRANLIHNNKYNYSKTIYTKSKDKVIITCPIHGDFEQRASAHLQGQGCIYCARVAKSNTQEFILNAKKVHGDKYGYSKVDYLGKDIDVIITCPIHGDFKQTPHNHLAGKGCFKCGHIEGGIKQRSNTKEFIEKAKKVHGNRYDYSLFKYVKSNIKSTVICPIHGKFDITPNNHLNSQGCPKCNRSHGETFIENYLINNNIKYISQYEIDIVKSINSSGKAFIDFYLPDYNIFIEYNGEQHYVPMRYSGGKLKFEMYLIPRDEYIKSYCINRNIKLLEIKYTLSMGEIENIFKDITK